MFQNNHFGSAHSSHEQVVYKMDVIQINDETLAFKIGPTFASLVGL